MIPSLAVILLCQLVGEVIARGLGLPIPGPVIGMAVMIVVLMLRDRFSAALPKPMTSDSLERTSRGILQYLSLLFVPAGVGVIQNLQVFGDYGVPLAIALIVSTIAALLATVATFVWVAKRFNVHTDRAP